MVTTPSCSQSVFFFIGTLLIECVIGIGTACTETVILALVAQYYPDKPGFARGVVELFVGVGVSVGPVFGGLFYHFVSPWRVFPRLRLPLFLSTHSVDVGRIRLAIWCGMRNPRCRFRHGFLYHQDFC